MKTPLIMFAYNRPDNLTRVVDSVKNRYRGKVIFIIDGPKEGQSKEAIDECVRIAEAADMPDKELIIHKSNRGLPGMSDDMDTISAEYERFIVLEDDCLPMPGFFDFINTALEYYENIKDVFAIGGYQPLPEKVFRREKVSVMSTYRFLCWGWATWSSKWKELRDGRINYTTLFDNLQSIPDTAGIDLKGGATAVREGIIKTWDIQVSLSMLHQNKVMIIPSKGLIKNIGLGKGTHGAGEYHPHHNLNVYNGDTGGWNFTKEIKPGKFNDLLREKIANQISPGFIRRIRNKSLKSIYKIKEKINGENR